MDEYLARRFEEHRGQLKSVAYRMLGSLTEADDAVQEAWLRLARSEADAIDNLGGWLTTVVGRVCLDMLRARRARHEEALEERLPDPVVTRDDAADPEHQALMADSIGLALLVVLESLSPAERLAFVLHDMFAVPFEQIGPLVDRTPEAARKLASRARHRVRGTAPVPDADLPAQRRVVDAFRAASRDGDFDALLAILDPDVALRLDNAAATGPVVISGAAAVAARVRTFQWYATRYAAEPALVNGNAGLVSTENGELRSVLGFTIAGGKIAAIDIWADPVRLARLAVPD